MNQDKYRLLFLAEARDHLNTINQALVNFEENRLERDAVDQIFRDLHSIKGMASSLDYLPIVAACHRLEELVALVRRDPRRHGLETADLFFEGVHLLNNMLKAIEEKTAPPEGENWKQRVQRALKGKKLSPPSLNTQEENTVAESLEIQKKPHHWNQIGLKIEISPDCQARSARAYTIIRNLGDKGKIIRVNPPVEEIRKGNLGPFLSLLLMTERTPRELVDFLETYPDVTRIETGGEEKLPSSGEPTVAQLLQKGSFVKIPSSTINDLVDLLGEFFSVREDLNLINRRHPSPALATEITTLGRLIQNLQDTVKRMRMVPVGFLLDRFPRLGRYLSHVLKKEVNFEILGGGVDVDRIILETLSDPVIHILRNAFDHGIEPPRERKKLGKNPKGTIKVVTYQEGDLLCIRIEDDGRGINPEEVKSRAVEMGLVKPDRAENLYPLEIFDLLCIPGFSTKKELTEVSGRGVGMDIVKDRITSLGGTLTIDSSPGKGTRLFLKVPLSLAATRVMNVEIGKTLFGIPVPQMIETGEVKKLISPAGKNKSFLTYNNERFPFVELAPLLGLVSGRSANHPISFFLADVRGAKMALGVDEFLGQRERVIKPLGNLLGKLNLFSGVAIGENNRPILILDFRTIITGHHEIIFTDH